MKHYNTVNGLLLVNKPADWTSHDVVAKIRYRFKIKKVGHGGTLDPFATGLLVIMLGKATKLSNRVSGMDKTYTGTALLGQTTDTMDTEGTVIASADPSAVGDEQIKAASADFTGTIEQLPPMFSAVKVKGKKLYELARKGIQVERKPRTVTIHNLETDTSRLPELDFELTCSSGTYVRTIFDDMGKKLGCGAHLTALCRKSIGEFDLSRAATIETITQWDVEELEKHVIKIEDAEKILPEPKQEQKN